MEDLERLANMKVKVTEQAKMYISSLFEGTDGKDDKM